MATKQVLEGLKKELGIRLELYRRAQEDYQNLSKKYKGLDKKYKELKKSSKKK